MGYDAFSRPLAGPSRKVPDWYGSSTETTDEEFEAMLPKEILKYAEKVENVEEAVMQEVKNHEKHQELPRFAPLTNEQLQQFRFDQAFAGNIVLQQAQQQVPAWPGQILG